MKIKMKIKIKIKIKMKIKRERKGGRLWVHSQASINQSFNKTNLYQSIKSLLDLLVFYMQTYIGFLIFSIHLVN